MGLADARHWESSAGTGGAGPSSSRQAPTVPDPATGVPDEPSRPTDRNLPSPLRNRLDRPVSSSRPNGTPRADAGSGRVVGHGGAGHGGRSAAGVRVVGGVGAVAPVLRQPVT